MSARRDVVVALVAPDQTTLHSWLVGIPADLPNDQALAEIIPVVAPDAMSEGLLSFDDDGKAQAMFGIRDADPVDDVDLYAKEARDKGLLN